MKNRSGFTLVEVAISVAILALAVVPIIRIFGLLPVNRTSVGIKGNVLYLSRLKTEEILNDFKINYDPSVSTDGIFSTENGIPNSDKYRYHIEITEESSVELKDLKITVYYDKNGNNTFDSEEPSITIYTKVAKHNEE